MQPLGTLFRRQAAGERGTSLLEFALFLPILLLLLLGVIDVGRYAEFNIVVANAAHAGAQYGAQNLVTAVDTTGIASAAVSDSQNALTAPQVTTSVLCGCAASGLSATCPVTCGSGHPLTYVQVTATGTFNSLFSYVVGVPASVSKTAEMRVSD